MGGTGSGWKKGVPQPHNRHFTEEMMTRLKVLWAEGPHNTASVCADMLRTEYRDYPGSITRSSVLGVIKRARDKDSPYYGWFAERQKLRTGKAVRHRNKGRPRQTTRAGRYGAAITHRTTPKRSLAESFNTVRGKFGAAPVVSEERAAELAVQGRKLVDRMFVPLEGSRPKTLFERGPNDCEWPVEVNGQTMYCSCPKVTLRYCKDHAGR